MPSTDASTSGSYTPREFIAFALAMLAAFALYVPNLRLELLADDYVFISQALRHPLTSLLGTTGGETFYRPLSRQIYFTGMAHLFGADPLPYHLVNLALYLLAAALLGHLARILLRPAAAPAAVVLFAGQHAGSVLTGWACCTQDLFALVFLVAALLLQIAGRRTWSLLTLVAGLLSKETAAVLPALVVVVEWKHLRKPLREALLAGRWHMALTGAWGLLYLAR
ncbi:MAG TPA: hypothetical protein VMS93_09685, partial [Candidatus Saccharimonadales bacterium]|nr:hypothetical protein [Candidatus Saccharimonadales bacterium]